MAVGGTALGASDPPAGWVDRVQLDFENQGARGQVLIDQLGSGEARVTTAIGKLLPDHDYLLRFSDDPCSVPLAQAEISKTVALHADSHGASFQALNVNAPSSVWRYGRSARLMEEEGIFYFCISPRRVQDVASAAADGSGGRLNQGGRRGLIQALVDTSEIKVALRGLEPGVAYNLLLSELTCAQILEGDPDQPIVVGNFKANGDGLALNRTETVDNNETITIGRSARLERASNGADWGCVNLKTFATWAPV